MNTTTDSRSEQIYKELRMEILTGKITGGTRLAESTLAKEKRVSRTPAREALQLLAKEGLLHAIPRSGYVVQELSDRDIMDLFETRQSIELVAELTAVGNISDAELVLLEKNLAKTKAAIENDSLENMIDLDSEFHDIIYKATRSKYLYRICHTLSDYSLKVRQSVIILPEVAIRTERDHLVIYNAFKSKDRKKIETSIKSHLEVVKTDILGYLSKLRQESF